MTYTGTNKNETNDTIATHEHTSMTVSLCHRAAATTICSCVFTGPIAYPCSFTAN
jgi:hypothetical protein